jgi:hypothetical protein
MLQAVLHCCYNLLQEPPQPGSPAAGGRQELLSAARALLDRKASAAGKQGAHFPLLLNSSGVMVSVENSGDAAVTCCCMLQCTFQLHSLFVLSCLIASSASVHCCILASTAAAAHPSISPVPPHPGVVYILPCCLSCKPFLQPMIIASAAFYGILPKAAEFVGLVGVANFIYGLQATGWGLLVYGLLVFAMEFLPFGAVNPPEVAEYFTMVSGIQGCYELGVGGFRLSACLFLPGRFCRLVR